MKNHCLEGSEPPWEGFWMDSICQLTTWGVLGIL